VALPLFERNEGRFAGNGGKTLQKLLEGFSAFQLVKQSPDRHASATEYWGSVKDVRIFEDDSHNLNLARAFENLGGGMWKSH